MNDKIFMNKKTQYHRDDNSPQIDVKVILIKILFFLFGGTYELLSQKQISKSSNA